MMVELRNGDPRAFHHFMTMPPAMFNELVERLRPRLTKPSINFRPNLDPGLKVALTLRHLASGTTYRNMQYAWRVPHNSISKIVREVVEAIVEECVDELLRQRFASDAQIYNASDLKDGLERNLIMGFPGSDPLPNDTYDVPYFIVGDDAFSLRTYLMKPYSSRYLTREERIFNYRLSRARWVVENAFGILANRFQIHLITMQHDPETVRSIVEACCILHNLMRIRYPVLQNRLVDRQQGNGDMDPGKWRQGLNLIDTVAVQGHNRASREAKKQRNLLRH
ncbi:putative nuclease HARBI1 [Diadema antillarum]|uniref:putative nuclease HARBI1 n=1 Tax=Diadema antillarum TaxID=105358 RepID=UPI003A88C9F6